MSTESHRSIRPGRTIRRHCLSYIIVVRARGLRVGNTRNERPYTRNNYCTYVETALLNKRCAIGRWLSVAADELLLFSEVSISTRATTIEGVILNRHNCRCNIIIMRSFVHVHNMITEHCTTVSVRRTSSVFLPDDDDYIYIYI